MKSLDNYNVNKVNVLKMILFEYNNLKLYYCRFCYEFGEMLVAKSDKGVCFAGFFADKEKGIEELKKRLPCADLFEDRFDNPFDREECTLHLWGTDFQLSVWKALLFVEKGTTATYSDIARLIGKPRALRAVGTAVGKNPVAVVIPCHRIIRSDGNIGNYHYGVEIKKCMLFWENVFVCL